MSARVKHFSSTRLHALREERHFALVEGFAFNKVTVLKIRDRTQNAHNTCNPCRTCGSCGSGNQQLIDNRAPRIVQLRPWPPHFKALSYPGETLVLWVAIHDKQKFWVATALRNR
jgi:hypothetical protein